MSTQTSENGSPVSGAEKVTLKGYCPNCQKDFSYEKNKDELPHGATTDTIICPHYCGQQVTANLDGRQDTFDRVKESMGTDQSSGYTYRAKPEDQIKEEPPKEPQDKQGNKNQPKEKVFFTGKCPKCYRVWTVTKAQDELSLGVTTYHYQCPRCLISFNLFLNEKPDPDPDEDQEDFDRLLIKLPSSAPWEPERSLLFITQLMAIPATISLQIWATAEAIQWAIFVQPTSHIQSVKNAVYANYDEATIIEGFYPVSLSEAEPRGRKWWSMRNTYSYVFPIRTIDTFRKLDPLTFLVTSLGTLEEDEAILYEVIINPPDSNLKYLAEKEIDRIFGTGCGDIIFLSLVAGIIAALTGSKTAPPPTAHDYVREQEKKQLEKIAREKITKILRWVDLKLSVYKPISQTRFETLTNYLRQHLELFASEHNDLKTGNPESYLVLSPDEVAPLWHLPNEQMKTNNIDWAKKEVPLTVDTPQGIVIGTNNYRGEARIVRLSDLDRESHVNLIGRTGVGKSNLLHKMIHQDIENGNGVGLIDPHGDLVRDILSSSIPTEREEDVVIFDVSDTDYPIGLNLLFRPSNVEPDALASQSLAVLRKLFAEEWRPYQMEDALYAALVALACNPGSTIMDILPLFSDPKFRRRIVSKVDDLVAKQFWMTDYENRSNRDQIQVAQPIQNRIRKLYRNKVMQRIIGQENTLDFRETLDQRKIFLANMGGLTNAEIEADILGAILIAQFQMAAMSRVDLEKDQRARFYLYIDEVQNFAATNLNEMFDETRKFGLSLTVANQRLSQLTGPTLSALLGNVGATIIFKSNPADARLLRDTVGKNFSPEDLINLDKYHAAVMMQFNGATLPAFSLATCPPIKPKPDAKDVITRLYDQSRQRYARPKEIVDAEILQRFNRDLEDISNDSDEEQPDFFD